MGSARSVGTDKTTKPRRALLNIVIDEGTAVLVLLGLAFVAVILLEELLRELRKQRGRR